MWTERRGAGRLLAIALAIGCLSASTVRAQPPPGAAPASAPQDPLAEARRAYDAQEFELALPLLDRAIDALQAQAGQEESRVAMLVAAYEMRARARLAPPRLDWDGARADFEALLIRSPRHVLPVTTSPRILKLFEDVRRATIGEIVLTVEPGDAVVVLDGQPLARSSAPIALVAGTHVIKARRPGYRPLADTVTVQPGTPARVVTVALERVSATLTLFTAPSGVDVLIDGIRVGTTPSGPPAAEDLELLATFDQAPAKLSGALVVADVAPGSHVIELRKECYGPVRKKIETPNQTDYRLPPQRLEPAVASVRLTATVKDARLFVDGRPGGALPAALQGLCEGKHTFAVLAPYGRFVRQVDLVAGQTLDLPVHLKPTFALVAATASDAKTAVPGDIREAVERAVGEGTTVALSVSPTDDVGRLLAERELGPAFLAFDAWRRPASEAAASLSALGRFTAVEDLTRQLDAQGLAAVTLPSNAEPGQVWLTLLAAGSRVPDVLEIDLQREESRRDAVARLGEQPSFYQPSVGLLAIDVAEVSGAVVASVDEAGPARSAGLLPGDIITRVNDAAIGDGSAFAARVKETRAGEELRVTARRADGAVVQASLRVAESPRLLMAADRGQLPNKRLLDIRLRLAEGTDPARESVIRLNLGVALMAVGDWKAARAELDLVTLPDGPGVSSGTVSYLRGLCAEQRGDRAEAERLWRLAANAGGAMLSEDGPPIKVLAERKLAELRQTKSGSSAEGRALFRDRGLSGRPVR